MPYSILHFKTKGLKCSKIKSAILKIDICMYKILIGIMVHSQLQTIDQNYAIYNYQKNHAIPN